MKTCIPPLFFVIYRYRNSSGGPRSSSAGPFSKSYFLYCCTGEGERIKAFCRAMVRIFSETVRMKVLLSEFAARRRSLT